MERLKLHETPIFIRFIAMMREKHIDVGSVHISLMYDTLFDQEHIQ